MQHTSFRHPTHCHLLQRQFLPRHLHSHFCNDLTSPHYSCNSPKSRLLPLRIIPTPTPARASNPLQIHPTLSPHPLAPPPPTPPLALTSITPLYQSLALIFPRSPNRLNCISALLSSQNRLPVHDTACACAYPTPHSKLHPPQLLPTTQRTFRPHQTPLVYVALTRTLASHQSPGTSILLSPAHSSGRMPHPSMSRDWDSNRSSALHSHPRYQLFAPPHPLPTRIFSHSLQSPLILSSPPFPTTSH